MGGAASRDKVRVDLREAPPVVAALPTDERRQAEEGQALVLTQEVIGMW